MDLVFPAKNQVVEETLAILEDVGLSDKAGTSSGSLSHGDQKILEMAIALGNRPELLVLDEPTAGMSLRETQLTMALVQRLANTKGLTILFSEHDMNVVFSTAQRIMVMHQGRSIIQGTKKEVRANKEVQSAYLGEVV
jgi:branched-chain amino acid transport system ATP-binding protein